MDDLPKEVATLKEKVATLENDLKSLHDEIAEFRQAPATVAGDDFVVHILSTYFREDFTKFQAEKSAN